MDSPDFEMKILFRSCADARARVRSVIESLLAHGDDPQFRPSEIDEILIGVQESLTNIARHAYAGAERPIELKIHLGRGRFAAEIRDQGEPLNAERLVFRDPREPSSSGRGLLLLHRSMDHVAFRREGKKNVLRIERASRAPRR